MFAMPPQPLSDEPLSEIDDHTSFIFNKIKDILVFVGGITISIILWKKYVKS